MKKEIYKLLATCKSVRELNELVISIIDYSRNHLRDGESLQVLDTDIDGDDVILTIEVVGEEHDIDIIIHEVFNDEYKLDLVK